MGLASGLVLLTVLRQNCGGLGRGCCYAVTLIYPILRLNQMLKLWWRCQEDSLNNIISPILDDCRLLVSRFQQVRIKHCFRLVNRYADSLARLSLTQDADSSSFVNLPVDLFNVMYFNRTCPKPFVFSQLLIELSVYQKPKKKKKEDHSTVPIYFFSGYRTHSNLSLIFLLVQS